MSEDPEDLLRLSLRVKKQGVAGFLATFVTSPQKEIVTALERMKKIIGLERGARILGVHLEGPFIHVERKGAHNPSYIRPPSLKEAREWIAAGEGLVKLVSLAPEIPGQEAVIRFLVEKGVRVSMGHTTATFAQAARGKQFGAKSVTHLFNAMNGLHHRDPGLLGYALLDRDLYTEVIADGVHVPNRTTEPTR